jgi:L-rhamnose isomerase
MADVLDIDNAEEFEVDEEGDRKYMPDWVRFTDNTSIVITHPELVYLQNIMSDAFANLNKWFKANRLALNFDKTNYIKFATKNKTS